MADTFEPYRDRQGNDETPKPTAWMHGVSPKDANRTVYRFESRRGLTVTVTPTVIPALAYLEEELENGVRLLSFRGT
jgi:hypothetical protein